MRRFFVGMLTCVGVASVSAHDLPTTSFDSSLNYGVATSFSLNASQIENSYNNYGQFFDYAEWVNFKRKEQGLKPILEDSCSSTTINPKTCGQVDHFLQAALVGTFTCNAYASVHMSSYPNGLIPQFTAPTSFVDNMDAASGHHDFYDLSQGISFDCVYPIKVIEDEPVELSPATVKL